MNIPPRPFIIYALPRSRTAWLSKFLTYGDWKCAHDLTCRMHSLDEIAAWLHNGHVGPLTGTAETGLVSAWKAVHLRTNAKRVVIRRSPIGVKESLRKIGVDWMDAEIDERAMKLDECAAYPGTRIYNYSNLNEEWACKEIFEWCLNLPFDKQWWLSLKNANIQVDSQKRIQELKDNAAGIQRLVAEMAAC